MVDFVCIGAQKAGTSWVHAQLEHLPDICFPRGKEVHFWDWAEAGRRRLNLPWYRAQVSAPPGKLAGDMTPAYATLSEASVRLFAGEEPDLRVFMMLRNPIDRAWSAAKMALVGAQLAMDEVDAHWFELHFRSAASLARSDYEATLRRWRTHFSPDQVRHFFFDDILARPADLLGRIYRFIGGRTEDPDAIAGASLRQRVRPGLEEPMPAGLWETLRDLYAPRIASLAAYLGEPLDGWLEPPSHLA